MPSIDSFVVKDSSAKKFKKVAHRPWTVISSLKEELNSEEEFVSPAPKEQEEANTIEEQKYPEVEHHQVQTVSDNVPQEKLLAPYPTPNNSEPFRNSSETTAFANNSQTVHEQSHNKPTTNTEQLNNTPKSIHKQFANSSQTINQHVLESLNNNHTTIQEPFNNNSETKFPVWNYDQNIIAYAKLVGFQKQVFLYIAKRCIANDSQVTGPISKQDLKENISSDLDTIKTSIQRLVQKGFVYRELSKSGTGGFSIFSIAAPIKKLVLEELNRQHVHEQFTNKPLTNREQSDHSSSSYNNIYNKTTNLSSHMFLNGLPNASETNEEQEITLSEGWETIDISNLEFIGFSKNHLSQLQKRSELTAEIIQDSINAFAFDLKHNGVGDKIKTHPLNYFMGILRANQPYAAPSNYQDPQVLAMREYLERKKQIREDKKKLEEEIFQLDFEEWQEGLSEETIAEIIPEARYREYPMKEGFLKTHFRKNIWQAKHKSS